MKLSQALPRAGNAALRAARQPQHVRAAALSTMASTATAPRGSSTASPRSVATPAARAQCLQQSVAGRRHGSSQAAEQEPLRKTALYNLHLAHGGKMVPFGGFHMPVQYSSLSVGDSHHFTRERASLFDVGHMVQHRFSGPGAAAFLQYVTPGSIAALKPHHSTLSALLWPDSGAIVDDTVVTRLPDPDRFYVVTNAACRAKDLAYLAERLAEFRALSPAAEVEHTVYEDQGLVALQGPLSEQILAEASEDGSEGLRSLLFGQSRFVRLRGAADPVLVSRGGYTGEDGFELSISPRDTVAATESLLAIAGPERLQLAGLGARDSLRLEAGMCLYGHDLDDTTTPAEGALSWIVGKDRREATDPAHGAFVGAAHLLPQLKLRSKGGAGVTRRRVGLVVEKGGAPAREGAEVVDVEGNVVGKVTSGCPSPTLGQNIAMAYVRDGLHRADTQLAVVVRGKTRPAVVTKMPFVPAKYWKGTAPA